MQVNAKNIFQAIHQGKWLSIEYRNKQNETTHYWIAIEGIDPLKRTLQVQGLHIHTCKWKQLKISIDSIQSSSLVDGSYYQPRKSLVNDLQNNDHKYRSLFGAIANLKTLSYLEDCNRLDTTPYKSEYSLIKHLDSDRFVNGCISLSDQQFKQIVAAFSRKAKEEREANSQGGIKLQQLALNVVSFHTRKGLYVLAYRPLLLDVTKKVLIADEITFCSSFKSENMKEELSIRQFLDDEAYYLLDEFEKNAETIKDHLTHHRGISEVDDRPYLVGIGFNTVIDLRSQYTGITDLYEKDALPIPLKAFFGELIKRPSRQKEYPIITLDKEVDLDQLLAINKAIKYPLAYIQGPPGTGKTSTIVNTIINAFFNGRTVLFASNNNHPVDGVVADLRSFTYRSRSIQFPIIRLGDLKTQKAALEFIKEVHQTVANITVYESTLARKRDGEAEQAHRLSILLANYEEKLDLIERRNCIEQLLETNSNLNFNTELETKQLKDIEEKIADIGTIKTADALALLPEHTDELLTYFYYTSARYLKRLNEPKNRTLLELAYSDEDENEQVKAFNEYLSNPDNLKNFLKIFPVVATTCISARRLGEPKPIFDMVIIDEASQCNIATSLVPIVRGANLMLVGDPQQLNPVVVLEPSVSEKLRRKYGVSDAYDYCKNSIYKSYLACDSVSDEVLLSHHYRCDPKIIDFNNKKYYNGKLKVKTKESQTESLSYYCVSLQSGDTKNTAPAEVEAIMTYIAKHQDEKIGIITPFANQRRLLEYHLQERGIRDVECGTVHAFQGDQMDTILFSLGLTDKTSRKTYAWLASNKELINVATSRAKKRLAVFANESELRKLHAGTEGVDDVYELVEYVKTNGESKVTERVSNSRALGIKPYSTKTETVFLESLTHALDNVFLPGSSFKVYREVPISQVFSENIACQHLFYTGRFDFVVYEKLSKDKEIPVLAVELDGKEHYNDAEVKRRDKAKNEICERHGFSLIRVDNSYARRYSYIKAILMNYFENV